MARTMTMAELPHRRFISWGWITLTSATVALAVGALAWTTGGASADDALPTETASPQPTSTVLPSNRYADAPRMTADAWAQVDRTWDVLVVGYPGEGTAVKPRGAYAVYLTPPGGERRLAFVQESIPDSQVKGLAWDPQRSYLLLGTAGNGFRVAALRDGAYVELEAPLDGSIDGVEGLGRASDGSSYVAITQGDRVMIASWNGGGWQDIANNDYAAVSPLSDDVVVASRGDDVVAYNVVTHEEFPLVGLAGCRFMTWATATDFSALCELAPDGSGEVFGANIAGGELRDLGSSDTTLFSAASRVLVAGTPIVLGPYVDMDVQAVAVLTDAGVHDVGQVSVVRSTLPVTLLQGTRWQLAGDGEFPLIVDAARGTLVDTADGFNLNVPVASVVLLPGDQR